MNVLFDGEMEVLAEAGQTIYYFDPTEEEIISDTGGDIAGRKFSASKPCRAFPIYMSPGQKQMDRAGMVGTINAIFWIPTAEFKNKIGKRPPDIIRHRIAWSVPGDEVQKNYEISQAHYKGTLNNGMLYVVIGGIEVT